MRWRFNLSKPIALLSTIAVTSTIPAIHADDDQHFSKLRVTIDSLNSVIEENPESAEAYQSRGVAYFELGEFHRAISDFDQVVRLYPGQEPHHWQRGICYYYAGEYEKGVKQFEWHQTVNSNDVENAVWHFICKAKRDGVKAARESLIPIKYDSRIPMNAIWLLFAGKGSPESVLESANSNGPDSPGSRQRLCYAHLYLGLYYEAHGLPILAKKHIERAATSYSMNNYMGMVAKVHNRFLNRQSNEP